MKLLLILLLCILALNALVVLTIAGILVADQVKARRKERHDEAAEA